MVVKNNINVYMMSQRSATISYLIYGIGGIILAIALEFAGIWNFFQCPVNEAIGVMVVLQLAVLVTLILIRMIPAYKRRREFMMCYVSVEDANIKSIKENYHICFMDQDGIIFVTKEDVDAYNDWKMLHEINNARSVKDILFEDAVAV